MILFNFLLIYWMVRHIFCFYWLLTFDLFRNIEVTGKEWEWLSYPIYVSKWLSRLLRIFLDLLQSVENHTCRHSMHHQYLFCIFKRLFPRIATKRRFGSLRIVYWYIKKFLYNRLFTFCLNYNMYNIRYLKLYAMAFVYVSFLFFSAKI